MENLSYTQIRFLGLLTSLAIPMKYSHTFFILFGRQLDEKPTWQKSQESDKLQAKPGLSLYLLYRIVTVVMIPMQAAMGSWKKVGT